MGPYIGLLLLLGASLTCTAPAIETDDGFVPDVVGTILNLVDERIQLEKAEAAEPSKAVQVALDANLKDLKAALKGSEDDLALILHLIKFENKSEEPSVDDADQYRLGRKKKRRPCIPGQTRRKKPRIGRLIGRILG
ncbi:unnamed protein product [Ixodes hexagonus]